MSIVQNAVQREPAPERMEGQRHGKFTNYRHDLTEHRYAEIRLCDELARQESLLHHKDEVIQQLKVLSAESDHRMMNSLQFLQSLLRLQSRASANTETATELAATANRVAMIGRVHQSLRRLDGVQTVAFTQFLEDLCRDLSMMMSAEERPKHVALVKKIDVELPATIAIPLSYIANELITNAAKHGIGRIAASFERDAAKGYALSVCNDGSYLPEGFDPTACKGQGMKIVRSLVEAINGELRIDRGDRDQGTRFTVLFS